MSIVGDGIERSSLESLVHRLGLGERVQFHGGVSNEEIPSLVNRSTLMLLPSRWQEPFGIVCLEAMMMERAVVASRVGGVPDVVEDGASGVLVEPDRPEALALAITSSLDDPAALRAMGRRARHLAESRFGYEQFLRKHLQVYEEAIVHSRSA